MRYTLLILALLLVACGGGGEDNTPYELPAYTPDFSTPEGATEAFARAIETQDAFMMERALAPDERRERLPDYLRNFEQSKQQGITWRLEFAKGAYIDNNRTVTQVTFFRIKNGVETKDQHFPAVFIKVEEGTWHYSPAETKAFREELERQRDSGEDTGENSKDDPADSPEDKPDSEEAVTPAD
jgi:hypothetical protein